MERSETIQLRDGEEAQIAGAAKLVLQHGQSLTVSEPAMITFERVDGKLDEPLQVRVA